MAEKPFRIGISSGFVSPTNPINHLPQKLTNVMTWGVNYTQIDIETLAEINKRDFLPGLIHAAKALGMKYGMHAEISGIVAMDSARSQIWDICHMRINEYMDLLYDFFYEKDEVSAKIADNPEDYRPEYIDFHISLTESILARSTQEEIRNEPCNTPWGKGNWDEFFESNPYLKKWFMLNLSRRFYERLAGVHQAYESHFKQKWFNKKVGEIVGTNQDINKEDLMKIASNDAEGDEEEIKRLKKRNEILSGNVTTNASEINKNLKLIEIYGKLKTVREAIEYYEEFRAAEDFDNPKKGDVDRKYSDILFDDKGYLKDLYDEWIAATERVNYEGTILGEQYAYLIIAKYLQFIYQGKSGMNEGKFQGKDYYKKFWENFINHTTGFAKDSKRVEDGMQQLEKEITPEGDTPVKTIEKNGTIHLHPDLVAMVAAFYIQMHWETPITESTQFFHYKDNLTRKGIKPNPTFHNLSPIEKLRKLKVYISFENPHLMDAARPGRQRIVRALDMEKFARTADFIFQDRPEMKRLEKKNWLYLLLDFGWWQANGMNPIEQVKETSDKFGEYVKAIQIHYSYAPGGQLNQGGAHLTIDIGSIVHERMYEWLRLLKVKGMKSAPIVFERGGGQNPLDTVKTSVFAIRGMVKELEKNPPTEIDKLPPEFFGFNTENIFSPERQMVVMKEHAFDPIKGMLEVKEFDHTFSGTHTLGKGKRVEDLAKERYK